MKNYSYSHGIKYSVFINTLFAYRVDKIIIQSYGSMITWLWRRTLMDLVPRGRIQHMLTRPRQHPLHSFDIPFFNYDIFSVFFFSVFFFCYFHFMFTTITSLAAPYWSGQYNLLFSSSRLRHTVSSLEDFFPGQRKNPKINWFCLHYSSLFTGKKHIYV